MRAIPHGFCIAAGLLFAASGAPAQAVPTHLQYGADLIVSGIDPVAAANAGIGDRAYGLLINGNLIAFRVLSLSAEGGLLETSDEDAFTQETNRGEQTSSVTALMGSLSAGLRTPELSLGGTRPLTLSAGLNAGSTWLNVSRGIVQCADCHDEDLNVRAGGFWEPAVWVGIGPGAVSARYRTYVGGSNVQNAWILGYSTAGPSRSRPAAAPPS